LAIIQQIDPVYVNLTQSSADALRLQRAMASGKLKSLGQGQAKVTLVTEDGREYPQAGKLLFSEVSVDESSGAVSLRAEFPNPDHFLLPGMYVRARLQQAVNDQAITVPQQAVVRGPEGTSVMVVGSDGKVATRAIKADTAQGDRWIVSDGLKAGDQVIVEGLQKIKPGAPVKAMPWTKAAANQPPPASQPNVGANPGPDAKTSAGAKPAASDSAQKAGQKI
jgi:membrane fusion protein (multidrug efflux system)